METTPNNIFVQLNKINEIISSSVSFGNFIIINTDYMCKLLDEIYWTLPEAILADRTNNNYPENKETDAPDDFEIPDFF